MKKIYAFLTGIAVIAALATRAQTTVDLKVYLEGPYFSGALTPWLNGWGYLPLDHPYDASPWFYYGPEAVTAIPNADVVDWVLVELRQTTGAASTAIQDSAIARQVGFILENGNIVGMDGNSPLQFSVAVTSNLYAVVMTRNHLGIMSGYPLQISGGVYTYDFTTGADKVYGGVNGHKLIATGVWAMVSGDGDSNGNVNNADKIDVWRPQSGNSGYLNGDFNMNGQVDNVDKNEYWKPNSGRSSQVPGGSANTPPVAIVQVNPPTGTTITVFTLDASTSHDAQSKPALLAARWDFENDGSWDTPYSTTKTIIHQYLAAGDYIIKVEVIDVGGLTDTETCNLQVGPSFGTPCPGIPTVTYEGQVYNTVQIGTQCWMKENLNMGSMINGSQNQTNNQVIEKYCYDNDLANCTTYGGLYQWNEMMQYVTTPGGKGICPDGWHLPTDGEFCTLTQFIDPTVNCGAVGWSGTNIGTKMKSTYGWYGGGNGTNASGFTALPGGWRGLDGFFTVPASNAAFWSSSESGSFAWGRYLYHNYSTVARDDVDKEYGFNVRCIKDAPPPVWSCGDTIVDARDGQVYNTVEIGTQCWMQENLNIGTMIQGTSNQTNNGTIEKYCYNNSTANCDVFGGLYQWNEMMQYVTTPGVKGICPDGWYLPTDAEYCTLTQYIDPTVNCSTIEWSGTDVGTKMKSTTGWYGGGNGTNASGFTALPGGYRNTDGYFDDLTLSAPFWTSSESVPIAWYRVLVHWTAAIYRYYHNKDFGLNVRCLKDPTPPTWSCGDTIIDARDNQVYNTVQIGTQCWMQENLNIGTMIQGISDQTNNGTIEKYCYDNNSGNCDVYGGLYQWNELMQYVTTPGVKGICPNGWHVPTDAEYCTLTQFIDPTVNCGSTGWSGTDVGTKMKSTIGWYGGGNGTNESGFTALPGGIRAIGIFMSATEAAFFWTSSEHISEAWHRYLVWELTTIQRSYTSANDGLSVRCLKDAPPPVWSCGDTIVDARDGQVYNTVQIGSQCWMQENLNIGTMVDVSASQTNNGEIEKYCYDNTTANCDVYGGLYQWNEMMQYVTAPGVKGICPDGWHLPTDAEWCVLEQYVDPTISCSTTGYRGIDGGGKLKEAGTTHWEPPNTGATNSSGFTALPGGHRYPGYFFFYLNYSAFIWSSSEGGADAWYRFLNFTDATIYRYTFNKNSGFSVRCVKGAPNQPPAQPSNPIPPDNATNQQINTQQSWACTDPENDPLTYDVYFGTTNPPNQVATGQTGTTYNPGILAYSTTYYWKIVAQDDHSNTTEGPVWMFTTLAASWTCGDPFTDPRDNQEYATVQIGTQCWMQENLNIGTMILGTSNQINNGTIEKYCYDNTAANCDVNGGLYQWNEMMQYVTTPGVKGICPDGWHVPTDAEYCTLTQFIDPTVDCGIAGWSGTDAGTKMKSTTGWYGGGNGTNASGFTALPCGGRNTYGYFYNLTDYATFWFSSGSGAVAWFRTLNSSYTTVGRGYNDKSYGFSVRCLHD